MVDNREAVKNCELERKTEVINVVRPASLGQLYQNAPFQEGVCKLSLRAGEAGTYFHRYMGHHLCQLPKPRWKQQGKRALEMSEAKERGDAYQDQQAEYSTSVSGSTRIVEQALAEPSIGVD